MNLLSVRPESGLVVAFTAFLPFRLPTSGKKAQNPPHILFTLFFASCILILYQYKLSIPLKTYFFLKKRSSLKSSMASVISSAQSPCSMAVRRML